MVLQTQTRGFDLLAYSWTTYRAYFSAFWKKTQFAENVKTQFENLKTQFEKLKTQFENANLNGEIEKLLYMTNFTSVRSLDGLK